MEDGTFFSAMERHMGSNPWIAYSGSAFLTKVLTSLLLSSRQPQNRRLLIYLFISERPHIINFQLQINDASLNSKAACLWFFLVFGFLGTSSAQVLWLHWPCS